MKIVIAIFVGLLAVSAIAQNSTAPTGPQRQPLTADKILEPLRTELGQCRQEAAVNKANLEIELDFTKQLQARVAQLEKEKSALESQVAEMKSAPGGVVKP